MNNNELAIMDNNELIKAINKLALYVVLLTTCSLFLSVTVLLLAIRVSQLS